MTSLDSLAGDVSPYVVGGFGLLGSIIGGAITGAASFLVGRRASQVAATSWIRDARREMSGRFLTLGQELLIVLEASHGFGRTEEAAEAVEDAHSRLFQVYPVLQLIATRSVVEGARVYAYRLMALKEGTLGPENFGTVSELVR